MEEDLKKALKTLQSGGIFLYPTDTVWGIGCDATQSNAIERIYQLKQRDDSKSMIILAAEEHDILTYTAHPNPDLFKLLSTSDRPTTIIYENARALPDNLVNSDGSIAIRIVKEPFCKALIKRLGKPIVSTSANISGHPTPQLFPEIEKEIKNGVDYIVKYRQEDQKKAQPSKIIKLQQNGEITILRD